VAPIRVSAERLIPAPAPRVDALLADYRVGHPSILPPAFSDFTVLTGGRAPGRASGSAYGPLGARA
jgi:hypothetical protein